MGCLLIELSERPLLKSQVLLGRGDFHHVVRSVLVRLCCLASTDWRGRVPDTGLLSFHPLLVRFNFIYLMARSC